MKDLLIITSYFPPEIGAASNRIFHLAEGLKSDYNVKVLTPLPNYPTGKVFKPYKGKLKVEESLNDISVVRLWIRASNSKNKLIRLVAMLSYSLSLMWYFLWHKIPNKVIIQSPPLLVAFTSVLFLRSKKRRLILNVSDLWPTAGLELGAIKKGFSYRVLKRIERFNYNNVDLILGQSKEILDHISNINASKQLLLYRNYPVITSYELLSETDQANDKLTIVYAGLLGVAQGIYTLLNALDYKSIQFHIYGSGAEEELIKGFISENPDLPIYFHGRLDRNELHKALLKYDVAIIPLLNRIYGSVPSKIFEFANLGLPLLYFGGGEGESIIKDYHLGWVASAGDYKNLNETIETISKKDITPETKKRIKATADSRFDFYKQIEDLKAVL
ncbi:MAG: glycosyltransferase family 4 protein [Winogradskyella sp.]|nr:glycosyltransferase family 4 protein [Winogradskyella sp.]